MNSGRTIKLRFFAGVREQVGREEEIVVLPLEIKTMGQVRNWLVGRGGVWAETFGSDSPLRVAYQHELCELDTEIHDRTTEHEIAFFPPVTGG